MTETTLIDSKPFSYWTSLWYVFTRRHAIPESLDIPLQAAILRSRWMTGWSMLILVIGLIWRYPAIIHRVNLLVTLNPSPHSLTAGVFLLLAVFVTSILGYGLLRLYTLVAHNLTTNIFKTRGQRLRLLNLETTLMTFSFPLTIGLMLTKVSLVAGGIVIGLSLLFLIILLSYGYTLIFHKRGLQGFYLLIGSTLLTLFVFLMGAIAVAVSLGVMAFFVLVILRLFVHP
jgi:hypothetical protein